MKLEGHDYSILHRYGRLQILKDNCGEINSKSVISSVHELISLGLQCGISETKNLKSFDSASTIWIRKRDPKIVVDTHKLIDSFIFALQKQNFVSTFS